MTLAARLRALASAVRFGRFVSVGALGAAVDTAVLALLYGALELRPVPAKLASAEAAILVMFVLNERWTFAGEGAPGYRSVLRRLVTSNLVRLGGALVATGVFSVALRAAPVEVVLFGADLWFLVANGAGILAGLAVNYVLESAVTWRVADAPE
ncbi:GtrA family protein [Halomarina halobia]|uniref:GtrA family protein n=1 Tax=Halomarina halobia TaxID=3033386 RepID=A0ABD6ACY2_9EURY|nr:GtrA family protein [Halomarina sp. PSR21]